MKKLIRLCCIILVIAFLMAGTSFITRPQKPVPDIFATPPPPLFKGVIHLWQVSHWEVGKSSRTRYLKEMAMAFERKYPGVFIEVHGMTEEQARLKWQMNGFLPADMLSFGPGFIEKPQEILKPLKVQRVLAANSGMQGDTCYALPYMVSGYGLFYNQMYFTQKQLSAPDNRENLNAALGALADFYKGSGRQKKRIDPLCISKGGLLCIDQLGQLGPFSYPEIGTKSMQECSRLFISGEAAMLLGTPRDWAILQGQIQENESYLSAEGVPLFRGQGTYFSDMVTGMSILKGVEGEKAKACEAFLDFLLQEEQQKALKDLYVFPVLKELSLYPEDPLLLAWQGNIVRTSYISLFVSDENLEAQYKAIRDKLLALSKG